MNRRQFLGLLIKGGVALGIIPSINIAFQKERIEKGIHGKTFYVDKPIVISNIDGLNITNCHFIKITNFDAPMVTINNCRNLVVQHCHFDASKFVTKQPGIFFEC